MREQDLRGTSVGQIEKRRETMADGRRYMIYYTFRTLQENSSSEEEAAQPTNVQQMNTVEQRNV